MKSKDLGFGEKSSSGKSKHARFINNDGSVNVLRKGLPFFRPYDLYHNLISMGWAKFVFLVSMSFFIGNLIFAILYTCIENQSLSAIDETSMLQKFWDSFFFSVQTMTTVGYGAMSPVSLWAKIISSVESFIGLLGFALVTGLLYGRFSRPQMKIKYSKNVLISPFKDGKALMFKMANQRSSKLIESEVTVVFIGVKDGQRIYHALDLQLSKINFFALTWTVVHPINEDSFLYGKTKEEIDALDAEIVILVKAFDDSFSQTVYSHMSYKAAEFVWDAKFDSSIFEEDGKMAIDLERISDYQKV